MLKRFRRFCSGRPACRYLANGQRIARHNDHNQTDAVLRGVGLPYAEVSEKQEKVDKTMFEYEGWQSELLRRSGRTPHGDLAPPLLYLVVAWKP